MLIVQKNTTSKPSLDHPVVPMMVEPQIGNSMELSPAQLRTDSAWPHPLQQQNITNSCETYSNESWTSANRTNNKNKKHQNLRHMRILLALTWYHHVGVKSGDRTFVLKLTFIVSIIFPCHDCIAADKYILVLTIKRQHSVNHVSSGQYQSKTQEKLNLEFGSHALQCKKWAPYYDRRLLRDPTSYRNRGTKSQMIHTSRSTALACLDHCIRTCPSQGILSTLAEIGATCMSNAGPLNYIVSRLCIMNVLT